MFISVADHVWARTRLLERRDSRLSWRGIVGSKACGLISLPEQWTPPFLVIATSLYRDWSQASQSVRHSLVAPPAAALTQYITERTGWSDRGLVIRSSAVRESMSDRGAYESLEIPADFDVHAVIRAVEQIYSTFAETGVGDEIALIVQSRIHANRRGHLSNERRVSKTINQWMWEIEAPQDADGRFNSQRSSIPSTHEPLTCNDESREALLKLLRAVGRWCTALNEGRTHLEWGLAGNAFWLFQVDFEDEQLDEGADPSMLFRPSDDTPSGTPPLGSSIHVADFNDKTGWPKIDKVKEFLDGRTDPYPKLFYLTGKELQSALESGRNLEADIRAVVHDRVVCRTDCKTTGIDRLNLPRTDTVSSRAALDFMIKTLAALGSQGASPAEICFIFHQFIPASVAAWALARPNQQVVLVDCLWGLPDGLQYLPHDTFEYDIKRAGISAEHIRYKPKFLQETDAGEWRLINVARNVARHRSLPSGDLREVATQTHRIANRLNKPIQIMWFCVVAKPVGIGRNVPWFMMEPEPAPASLDEPIAPGKKHIPIKSLKDLKTAQQQQTGKFVLALEPEGGLFRSSEFLNDVVSVSLEKQFPVSMTGSILSHAYYTLERRGVSVITDTSRRSRVRHRQVFRKLVRDEIPAKIAEHGERANLARIAKHESRTALVIKLLEEAQELLRATSPKEVTAELADLLEVVRALTAATGADWKEVQDVAEEKRQTRGSFERNVVLIETSWPQWAEPSRPGRPQDVIPLEDLGEVVGGDGIYQLNFASVIAPGAKNIVDLGHGVRVAISIVSGGVRVERVYPPQRSDPRQLNFGFVSAKDFEPSGN
jgi:predicted house-cleaning noncanonical NTP pyrophosphatase (MazG superfamily)